MVSQSQALQQMLDKIAEIHKLEGSSENPTAGGGVTASAAGHSLPLLSLDVDDSVAQIVEREDNDGVVLSLGA